MCGPDETERRDEDRTDRGERGLERGEPSRPSSGYLRALTLPPPIIPFYGRIQNTTKHRPLTPTSCIPPRFW